MNNPRIIVLVLMAFGLCGTGIAYAGNNAQQEITTAITHAGYADKMTDVNQIHLHLHHVVNCLVGTNGAGFDAKAGDPCLHMGSGAINDFKGDKLQHDMLSQALQEAEYGLMTDRANIAHNAADLTKKSLNNAVTDM
jgi:hypothetical protein